MIDKHGVQFLLCQKAFDISYCLYYILMANEGYREAMVGNFSLYDCHGERQHTLYLTRDCGV
jgi:hypothetical protein